MRYRLCTCGIKNKIVQGVDYCQNCGDFVKHLPIVDDIVIENMVDENIVKTSKPRKNKKTKGKK